MFPAGLDAVRSLAGPLRAGQPTMKFVMDTSKYWFKPSITRDQGKAASVSAGTTPPQPCSLRDCCLSPALRFASPQLLSPALAHAEVRWGLSNRNSKCIGADGHGETHSQVQGEGSETRAWHGRSVPASSPTKLLLPLTAAQHGLERGSVLGTTRTHGTEPGPLSLQGRCSRYPHRGRACPQQTLLSIPRCCQGTTPRASIGRRRNAARGGSTCFAWLSLRLCFDSDPAAEGQGARHVPCAGQHVVPGVFWAGDEGSRLSVQQPDRYRDLLRWWGLLQGFH